jgi:hypothetical protein
VSSSSTHTFLVSIKIRLATGRPNWWLTSVYEPTRDGDKPTFLTKLHELCAVRTGAWLINGDFNLIYRAEDKNNSKLNWRLMGQFWHVLNEAQLMECNLEGRLYTWSNEREHPTLEKIDQVFFTNEWEVIHPNHHLFSVATLWSDHAPLVMRTDASFVGKKHFHFYSFWARAPDFLEMVASAWRCPLYDGSPFKRLDWLFRNMARVLKARVTGLLAMCGCNLRSPERLFTSLRWPMTVTTWLPSKRR